MKTMLITLAISVLALSYTWVYKKATLAEKSNCQEKEIGAKESTLDFVRESKKIREKDDEVADYIARNKLIMEL